MKGKIQCVYIYVCVEVGRGIDGLKNSSTAGTVVLIEGLARTPEILAYTPKESLGEDGPPEEGPHDDRTLREGTEKSLVSDSQ